MTGGGLVLSGDPATEARAGFFLSSQVERFFLGGLLPVVSKIAQSVGMPMSSAGDYLEKAAELVAMAKVAPDAARRVQYENLARSYLRLAMQADKDAPTDIAHRTLPEWPAVQQQQQQRQPMKKSRK